jgi:hypothetical protein
MSGFDDYEDEMANNGLSDRDIERLLSGLPPENEELLSLASRLQLLREQSIRGVSEGEVAAFARSAAEATGSAKSVVSRPANVAPRRRFARPRWATALAFALLVSGMTGVALASNGAAPGDALYGLDRALERIGIGNGAAAERIAEAQALFQGGLVSEAVAHAAGALEGHSLSENASNAVEALADAAEAVTNTDEGEADSVRAKVAEMLNWMAANTTGEDPGLGSEFDEIVAGFARGIAGGPDGDGNSADQPLETPGPPEGVPGGRPENVPPGPPANVPPRP